MRTWRLLFAVGLLAALVVPATGASAKPHETGTTPHTTCDVDGGVTLSGHDDNPTGGLDNNKSEGHYRFEEASLECDGDKGGLYDVVAEGDTTDLWHGNQKKDPTNNENGEDCEQGGSAKAADGDLHSGSLVAFFANTTNKKYDFGKVHFARLGVEVLADGPIYNVPADRWDFFQAELVFTPTQGDCMDKEDPVTEADLDGVALIYDTTALGYFHDCTLDGVDKHNADPHCVPNIPQP